jgi:hypothetical protein
MKAGDGSVPPPPPATSLGAASTARTQPSSDGAPAAPKGGCAGCTLVPAPRVIAPSPWLVALFAVLVAARRRRASRDA